MKAVVNIIGFDVSNSEQRALKEVAKAGGGTYQSANSAKELEEQLRKKRQQLEKEVIEWGNLSVDDLGKRHQELLKLNGELKEKLSEMQSRESNNLYAAQMYLIDNHVVSSPTDLYTAIHNREVMIRKYISDLNEDTDSAIYRGYNEAYQKLKRKKDEVLDGDN